MGPTPSPAAEPFATDVVLAKPDWYSHIEISDQSEETS